MTCINNENHTDIKQLAWIERFFPEPAKPYAYVMRLDRPIGIWLLLLPGLWGIFIAGGGILNMGIKDWVTIALFCFGAIIMRAAGCIINDLWDCKIDNMVERTKFRPIASGQISIKQSLAFLLILLLIGFIILMQFNFLTVILGIVSLPLIVAYPLMKRITWWPQVFLGLTFNFSALMGWSAVAGTLSIAPIMLYIGAIFWTLAYDTIYAHQDMEDDIGIGVKSTALLFKENSKEWVASSLTLAYAFFTLTLIFGSKTPFTDPLLALAGAHFLWQIKIWDPNSPQSSLHFFKANRDAGVLILLACL